jgi:hypothetical protein
MAISFIGPGEEGLNDTDDPCSLRSKITRFRYHGFIPGPEAAPTRVQVNLSKHDSEQLSILQALDLQRWNTGPIRGLPICGLPRTAGQATATPSRLG